MLKQDRHYLNAMAEELARQDDPVPEGMYAARNDGARVHDGTSYFHGRACGGVVKPRGPLRFIGE